MTTETPTNTPPAGRERKADRRRSAPRVLISVDKFKGCLAGRAVASAICSGIMATEPAASVVLHPVSDGGDGFVAELGHHGFTLHSVSTSDALRRPVTASIAVHDGVVALEMATASGLDLIPEHERQPVVADTWGLGVLLEAARAFAPRKIIIGAGGSATTDGGAGALAAMGAKIFENSGAALTSFGPNSLIHACRADFSALTEWRDIHIEVASDVTNPLLGATGAAAIFGPQKGATSADIAFMERALAAWANVAEKATGRSRRHASGSGAAGGLAFGLDIALGARITNGLQEFAALTNLEAAVESADYVITGEGNFDDQTAAGKAPMGVLRIAQKYDKPCWIITGRTEVSDRRAKNLGFAGQLSLMHLEPDQETSISQATELLRQMGTHWAQLLKLRDCVFSSAHLT